MLSCIEGTDTQCKTSFGVQDGSKFWAHWVSEHLHDFYHLTPAGPLSQASMLVHSCQN